MVWVRLRVRACGCVAVWLCCCGWCGCVGDCGWVRVGWCCGVWGCGCSVSVGVDVGVGVLVGVSAGAKDHAGRIRQGPAPKNLELPPYLRGVDWGWGWGCVGWGGLRWDGMGGMGWGGVGRGGDSIPFAPREGLPPSTCPPTHLSHPHHPNGLTTPHTHTHTHPHTHTHLYA